MRSLIAVIITAACAISLSQSSALAQEIPQKKLMIRDAQHMQLLSQ